MADVLTSLFDVLHSRYKDQPRMENVDHIDVFPSLAYLMNHVMGRGFPVVFKQSGVQPRTEVEVINLLLENCGDLEMQIRRATFDTPSQYVTDRNLQTVALRDYLRGLTVNEAYAGNQKLPQALENILQLSPPSFGDNTIEPPTFWLGGRGSVTPLHKDSTDNFSYQIYGTKRWTLFPVRDIPFLYMERPVIDSDFAISRVDLNRPDLDCFPLFVNAKPVIVDVHAGEMLYLPAGWAHHVVNLTTSLMVNYWMSRDYFARSLH